MDGEVAGEVDVCVGDCGAVGDTTLDKWDGVSDLVT